jgi:hypothetical protein
LEDLKLIGEREDKLKTYLLTIGNFSDIIHTEFGLEKCAKIVSERIIIALTNLVHDIITVLQHLEQGNTSEGGKVKFYINKRKKFSKGNKPGVKDVTEIRDENQEKYYSNQNINCARINRARINCARIDCARINCARINCAHIKPQFLVINWAFLELQ